MQSIFQTKSVCFFTFFFINCMIFLSSSYAISCILFFFITFSILELAGVSQGDSIFSRNTTCSSNTFFCICMNSYACSQKKKNAFKDLCEDGCEANKVLHKKIRNRSKKVEASAMRKEAEKETKDLRKAEPCFQVDIVDQKRRERCHRR